MNRRKGRQMTTIGFEAHDHKHCIQDGLEELRAQCAAQNLQLTPVRQRVMELLLEKHRAIGAYEILDHLRAEGLGSQPPVAYRALDFLVSNGFAHRIERLNAFVGCAHLGKPHVPAFLICRSCDLVAEAPSGRVSRVLGRAAREIGFQVEKLVVEAEGLCPSCAEGSPA